MFSKKKQQRPRKNHSGNLSQYGLFDIPNDVDAEGVDDGFDDDSDLEAELMAISNEAGAKPKRPARRKPESATNLDAMIADSLKDVPSDDDESVDENDPNLLAELSEFGYEETSPVVESPTKESPATEINSILEDRLKMYITAESNAKAAGESSRARRIGRGIKTIKDLIKQASAGHKINPDDIPPEVAVTVQKHDPPPDPTPSSPQDPPPPLEPTRPAPVPIPQPATPPEEQPELSPETKEIIDMLNKRKLEYKTAAVRAKKSGDVATAVNYVKTVKQFEAVIKAVEAGQPVDLSNIPESPTNLSNIPGPPINETVPTENSQVQKHTEELHPTENIEEEAAQLSLISAGSIGEALQQRLDLYKKQEEAAKEQGNSSKARRMGRIVKQYEQAIKLHSQGKPFAADELPTPPGYAPLPGTVKPPEPEPSVATKPIPPTPSASSQVPPPPPPSAPVHPNSRQSGNHVPTSRMEKQLAFLKARQREFKEAALNAKKKGELSQAKEFLKSAKGFEPLIQAAEGGLPIDIASLPIPPVAKSQLDTEYDFVMTEECTEENDQVIDVVTRLEQQLTKQLKMCLTTRDHHKALGDVAGTNRFEHLALSVTKDLDIVRLAKRTNGATVPKFHYETKDFSIVKSFTDLNDNDLQLTIMRGINYNCTNPKEVDTYVKFEFPFPQEEPVKDKTSTVKDTNNPEYNATFILPIQRTARPCLRVFKRHAIKFEVYSRGGFFRGDTLLGTVNVKLQPLETKSELHESFDLMDGRKKIGGKLEIRLRLRNPLVSREVQQLSERWLVIDH